MKQHVSVRCLAGTKTKPVRSTAISKELRRNNRIRLSPIRLIDENQEQAGIVETKDALRRALDLDLDLVEVSPNAKPPVCRIMNYGKYMYELQKKERKAKAHRHETELKEIRIKTPKIDTHDLGIKIKHAREFLERGDRVQFSLRFRGRELAHIDEGQRRFTEIKKSLADIARVDQDFRREGRRITMLLAPLSKEQREKLQRDLKEAEEAKKATPTPKTPSAE